MEAVEMKASFGFVCPVEFAAGCQLVRGWMW